VPSVVVLGLAGYMPFAGVALHYVQYCLGLRELGVDVLYLEDHGGWPYVPATNEFDGSGTQTLEFLRAIFDYFDLEWAYMDPTGRYHGCSEAEAKNRCRAADLVLNVSGGHEPVDHHRTGKALVYVDTDPGYVQVKAALGDERTTRWLSGHDLFFTFGEKMGAFDCRVPDAGFEWRTTRQPVHLPFWAEVDQTPGDVYTTVMNWRSYNSVEWQGETWGQKDAEFHLVRDLPTATGLPLEVAMSWFESPWDELRADGWRVVDARQPTDTIWNFRDYIGDSRGEVSVSKQGYVRAHSGWFSERSANYLAAGRPVVLQDTGWSDFLPTGRGLFSFTTTEQAQAALRDIEDDPLAHATAARKIAAENFDGARVLDRFLSDAGVT
jgi:hypothetical protein